MRLLILAFWVLNVFDMISTSLALRAGWAEEANPVMAALYAEDHGLAIAVKFMIGTLCAGWLWQNREKRTARVITAFALALYGAQAAWQAYLWLLYLHVFRL